MGRAAAAQMPRIARRLYWVTVTRGRTGSGSVGVGRRWSVDTVMAAPSAGPRSIEALLPMVRAEAAGVVGPAALPARRVVHPRMYVAIGLGADAAPGRSRRGW